MKILFVDNHPEFTGVVTHAFLREHEVVVVATIASARAAVEANRFDAVLVDFDLDDGKGDELVRWLRTRSPSLRIIAVSARADGNVALVAAGADCTCAKADFKEIATALRGPR